METFQIQVNTKPSAQKKFFGLIEAETYDLIMKYFALASSLMKLSAMVTAFELFSNLPTCCGISEQGFDPDAAIAGMTFAIIVIAAKTRLESFDSLLDCNFQHLRHHDIFQHTFPWI